MKTRIPFDEIYVKLIGQAVYTFSYYEWQIIYLVEQLQPGFVKAYSRPCGKPPMASYRVFEAFEAALKEAPSDFDGNKEAFKACMNKFKNLIPRRNALIHAHPITDINGAQVLNYQSALSKPISDLKWDEKEISNFIKAVDEAVCQASKVFDNLKDP